MLEIKRRTFRALDYPKGSKERIKLNEEILTSEYLTDYKYIIQAGNHTFKTFKTFKECEDYLK